MELVEPIEQINSRLKDYYGIATDSGNPIWRVVLAEEQFEHCHDTFTDFTEGGIFLREVTETRWVRKYNWINQRYILEQLVAVPVVNLKDLPATKQSYELLYVFEGKNDRYLPPKFEVCQILIDLSYAARGKSNLRKYIDPEETEEGRAEVKAKRVAEYTEYLFGDQSSLQGTTKTGESIIVPRNFEKS